MFRNCAYPLVAAAAVSGLAMRAGGSTGPILQTSGELLTTAPCSSFAGQGIKPTYTDRAVNLDGTLRHAVPFGMFVAGNPFEPGTCDLSIVLNSVNLISGQYSATVVDMAPPTLGPSFQIVRTYNPTEDANGYQGKGWFQGSTPVLHEGTGACGIKEGSNDRDVLRLMLGADRYLEFVQTGTGASLYKGRNGAAGVVRKWTDTAPNPDLDFFEYTDQRGNKMTFLREVGGNLYFWKVEDTAGQIAYFGSTTATDVISTGYKSDGSPNVAFDASGRKYTYTYSASTIGGVKRLIKVEAQQLVSSTWTLVEQVEYEYYGSGSSNGNEGDLKLVTVTSPLSPSGTDLIRKTYYRYITASGTNKAVRLVVGNEGVRRWESEQTTAIDSASDNDLKPYTESYFEYSNSLIVTANFSGRCGCSGGGTTGTHTFAYAKPNTTVQSNTIYNAGWPNAGYRTTITQPDGLIHMVTFDEVGQVIGHVRKTSGTSPTVWAETLERNADGQILKRYSPLAVNYNATNDTWAPATTGMITELVRVASGDAAGLPSSISYKDGTSGTATLVSDTTYTLRNLLPVGGASTHIASPFVATSSVYPDGTAITTDYEYTWHSATDTSPGFVTHKSVTVKQPAVSAANNGDGDRPTTTRYLRTDGSTAFVKDPVGTISYQRQDAFGRVDRRIQDVDTSSGDIASGDAASIWSLSSSGTPLHIKTDITYDRQSRVVTVTAPAPGGTRTSRMTYTRLSDGRPVTLSIPSEAATPTLVYKGPTAYRVSNLAGGTEFSGTLALPSSGTTTDPTTWISTASADPISAISSSILGSGGVNLHGGVRTIYDKPGALVTASRVMVAHVGSLSGATTSQYDEATYAYDGMGRLTDTTSPAGTITRTDYDSRGWPSATKIGVNTSALAQTSSTTYDLNGRATSRSLDPGGTPRTTTFSYDYRGRLIAQQNPQAPHSVYAYDNLDRPTAVAQYSSASGFGPSSVPTTATARVALSETAYDERGQVYQTSRSEINQSNGSPISTLTSEYWYDAAGRRIKTDGEEITKTFYDRIGRPTRSFVLAKHNDSTYADASSLSGDTVVEESRTVYDNIHDSGLPMMSVSIRRHHNSTGTGELETSISEYAATQPSTGRTQITAMWYDELGRQTHVAQIGTNSGSTYSRATGTTYASVPTTGALVSESQYDDAGNVKSVLDPKGTKTTTQFDAARRRTAVIRNDTGSVGAANRDNKVYTRYEYDKQRLKKMWVDVNGDGSVNIAGSGSMNDDDQVTEYTYGVATGAGSGLNSNDLLASVIYPHQSTSQAAADRTVTYTYTLLGELKTTTDQNGTVHTYTYDTAGRRTRDTATPGTGINGAVEYVDLAYTDRGQVSTVTQYGTVGLSTVVLDQLQYEYDGWGNVSAIVQDRNSAINASGSDDEVRVAYTYAVANTAGQRAAVRRTVQTITYNTASSPVQTLNYGYGTSGGVNSSLSRVFEVTDPVASQTLAQYEYLGLATKVGTILPEANMVSRLHTNASTPVYDALDEYDRVKISRWNVHSGGSIGTPYYSTTVAYDAASNILSTDDAVLRARDVKYTIDGLDRVAGAQEGTLTGSTISGQSRKEEWTSLSQTGNWLRFKRWMDDGAAGTVLDAEGQFSAANELNERDLTPGVNPTTPEATLAYDKAGNQTDDGQHFTYTYDAWGRLVEVKKKSGGALVAKYRYNGLGFRIGWLHDADQNGTTTETGSGHDNWLWFIYNDRWQQLASFRVLATAVNGWAYDPGSDTTPKELFVNHAAGLDGLGGSSYIDEVVLRDADETTDTPSPGTPNWAGASDNAFDGRLFYLQNWRADVVVTVKEAVEDSPPAVVDHVRYSSYGVPWGTSMADVTGLGGATYAPDGQITADDTIAFVNAYGTPDLLADVTGIGGGQDQLTPPDGQVTVDDLIAFLAAAGDDASNTGRGLLSRTHSRRGYAGYEYDPGLEFASRGLTANAAPDPIVIIPSRAMWHVRNRVLDSETGRWTRRDPLGYVDGMGLYEYVKSLPITHIDFDAMSAISTVVPLSQLFPFRIPSLTPGPPTTPSRPGITPPSRRDRDFPTPIWVDNCTREAKTFAECAFCCFRGYNRQFSACLDQYQRDIDAADASWWKDRAKRLVKEAAERFARCKRQADWNYSDCVAFCREQFPQKPTDKPYQVPPIHPDYICTP